jgi:molybdate transport system substrate-binding protein
LLLHLHPVQFLIPRLFFVVKSLRHLLAFAALFATSLAGAAELTVFAAASLSDAFKEIAPLYTKATGDTLRFNFGASGALARQIKEGAPADVIFSADELRMDQLEKDGLLLAGTRRTLLANTLVLVVASDNTTVTAFADLTKPTVRRVVFGDPATVPVGTYAKKYLEPLGLWEPLQPKSVFVDNVRAVLAAVEAGNADAGMVYQTDALISKKVKVAIAVSQADGPPITYPAAVVKDSKSPEAAKKFVLWLAGAEARAVFTKYGFLGGATSPSSAAH